MPFIPSLQTQTPLEKKTYTPVVTSDDPSIGEVTAALVRQENSIGSFFTQEYGLPETKDDPDFDAYSFFTEEEKANAGFVNEAIYADNMDEIESVRRQLAKETKDRETIAAGGATSFVLGLPVGALDLTSLLSIGGIYANTYRAGKSVLSNAAVTGSIVAADSAITEAALHSTQLTRTYGESAVNVGASAIFGSILGGVVSQFGKYGIDKKAIEEMADVMDVEPKLLQGINPAINAQTVPVDGDSVGAARAVFGNFEVKGKNIAKFTKFVGFDPLSRTITNPFVEVRRIVNQLAENPIEVDSAPLQAVESLAKIQTGRLATSIENNNKLFAEYKKAGGKMKHRQFNEAVARAIRSGKSDIPQVQQSARFWYDELYTPLKDEMVATGLLPEDVNITTSVNYLNRVWDKNKISANYNVFIAKVSDWLETKDLELYESAKDAASKIDEAESAEQIKLQKIIDKAEFKKGKEFERQDYEAVAAEIATRIQGSPDGRLPYEWKMGDGTKSGGVNNAGVRGTALRGPLRSRVFQIDDDLIEEFLENDIEVLGSRYIQQTAADIELQKRFGSVTMDEQIREINGVYDRAKKDAGDNEKELMRLEKERTQVLTDIAGMRDRIRGVYGFQEDNVWTRIGRSARDLNYLRLLGGVTVSSLPDIARIVMAEGFVKSFSKGLAPLVRNSKTFKIAAAEARRYGVGTDALMTGKSEIIADVGDYTQGGTFIERGLRAGANKFGRINLLDYWTAGMKQLHAVTMQTSIFDGLSKGKYDKRLARLGIDEQSAKDMWEQVNKHGKFEDGVWITNAKNWDDPALERMWGAAVRKESDRVILIPGQEKPLFMSSELGKSIGQFRSFILSATQRVLIAGLQRQDHNALGGAMTLVGMGMFSYYMKQKIAGREVSDDPGVWIAEGIDRSGVIGVLGEINNTVEKISSNSFGLRPLLGVDAPASRFFSRSVSEAILGPTFGSGLSTLVTASNAVTSSEPMTESDVRALRRLIPLQNLVGVNKAFDQVEKAIID